MPITRRSRLLQVHRDAVAGSTGHGHVCKHRVGRRLVIVWSRRRRRLWPLMRALTLSMRMRARRGRRSPWQMRRAWTAFSAHGSGPDRSWLLSGCCCCGRGGRGGDCTTGLLGDGHDQCRQLARMTSRCLHLLPLPPLLLRVYSGLFSAIFSKGDLNSRDCLE